MAIGFACGNCGKAYRIDERFAGKKVACRTCGKINVVPGAPSPATPVSLQQQPQPQAPEGVIAMLPEEETLSINEVAAEVLPEEDNALELDEAPPDQNDTIAQAPVATVAPRGVPQPVTPVARSLAEQAVQAGECPNCGTPIEKNAVICTGCGLNFQTGEQINTATEAPDKGFVELASGTGVYGKVAMYLVGIGLVISLLAIVGARGFAILGMVLALTGAILYAIDGAWGHAGAGGGASVFALVLYLLTRPAPPPPPAPVVVAPPPPPPPPTTVAVATQPAPEPIPESVMVTKVGPGVFRHNNPGKNQNPVEFWSPLRSDPDPEVRLFMVQQLSRVPDANRTQARDLIAEMVGDNDARVRRSALLNVTQTQSPKAIEGVMRGLNDADDDVALIAIRASGRFHDESTIDLLVNKYDRFPDEVLDALAQFGPESAARVNQAYSNMLSSGQPASRVKLIGVLVKRDPEKAPQLLLPLISDGTPEIRVEAMSRLADMKNAAALLAMLDRLSEDAENVTRAVKKYGPTAEAPVLARLVDSATDTQRKVLLLNLLKEIGTTQSLRAVKKLARDPEFPVAVAAREVWRKLAPGEFTELDEALLDLDAERPEFVARALEMLAKMEPNSADPESELRKSYEDQRARVLRKVYLIVAKNEGEAASRAIPALIAWSTKQYRDSLFGSIRPEPKVPNPLSDPVKRVTAMRVAGATKEPTALMPLVVCLEANTETTTATEAIKQYGSVAEEQVIRLLFRCKPEVQQACCELLKTIGTARCQPALLRIVWLAKDPGAKQMARETLAAIQERLAAERDKAMNAEKVEGR
jgi:HEAT repeat protein